MEKDIETETEIYFKELACVIVWLIKSEIYRTSRQARDSIDVAILNLNARKSSGIFIPLS